MSRKRASARRLVEPGATQNVKTFPHNPLSRLAGRNPSLRKQLATIVVALFIALIFTGCNNGSGGQNATSSQPAPFVTNDPITFEVMPPFTGQQREVGAYQYSNLLQIKVTAQEAGTKLLDLRVALQDVETRISASITLYRANGDFVDSVGATSKTDGSLQVIDQNNSGAPQLVTFNNVGDYAEIFVLVDSQGEDNYLYTSELIDARVELANGSSFSVIPQLAVTETVLLEEMPNVKFFHSSNTTSVVSIGSPNAKIASIQMSNLSQTHAVSLIYLVVNRETPGGDTAPLTLTQNGHIIAHGIDYAWVDMNTMQTVEYTAFRIPAGVIVANPLGSTQFSVEADLRNSSGGDLVYTIASADTELTNGQSLGQGPLFLDPVTQNHRLFTVKQQ